MGEKPNCDAWAEAKDYVDDFCFNEGYIHELLQSTTPAPGALHHWSDIGCHLIS